MDGMDERDIPETVEFVKHLLPRMNLQEAVQLLDLLSKIETRIVKEANANGPKKEF